MQLTVHTDYGLRVLLYLAHFPEKRVGTEEISTAYGISKNHLVRVVQTLAEGGFVKVTVGRTGGVQLGRPPAEIRLGEVVRKTEPSFRLVECHDMEHNTCPIVPVCSLKSILDHALELFIQDLDRYTLADLAQDRSRARFVELVSLEPTSRR